MTPSLKQAIERNQSLPCALPGCNHPRHKLYATCSHHFFRRRLSGHPKARAIKKRELRFERKQVSDLIRNNLNHEGIQEAISWFDKWLRDAARDRPIVGAHHIARLYDSGIQGTDLLITCAAVYLYGIRNPQILPDDMSINYAFTHQIMRLVPRECVKSRTGKTRAVVMKGLDRKAIGEHIWKNLGLLFVNISHHLDEIEEKKHHVNQAFSKKFEI